MTVAEIIGEPLLVNGMINNSEREIIICDLLEQVGLKTEHLRRYPHAFSGGQRQRIGIAIDTGGPRTTCIDCNSNTLSLSTTESMRIPA